MSEFQSLRICTLAFHKAARGRRGQAVVQEFASRLDERIAVISDAIGKETFPIGRFQQFVIRDPKQRVITAPCFEERVLHHAIMNVCEPVMNRWLIDDTFACRTGKGREAAVHRAHEFSRKFEWFLKLDVRKYFDSVSHEKLINLLAMRFKDRRLLELLNRIIRAYRGDLGIGLPIGSLTSQHFANFYLGWLDRFAKETLAHSRVRAIHGRPRTLGHQSCSTWSIFTGDARISRHLTCSWSSSRGKCGVRLRVLPSSVVESGPLTWS